MSIIVNSVLILQPPVLIYQDDGILLKKPSNIIDLLESLAQPTSPSITTRPENTPSPPLSNNPGALPAHPHKEGTVHHSGGGIHGKGKGNGRNAGTANGGTVTTGPITGGESTAIGIAGGFYNNCNQCTIITAPQATGGAATSGPVTGGTAIDPGATGRAATDVSTLVDNGNALFVQGNYTQAIQYYDKALAIDPKFKEALNNKGIATANLGNYTQAIQYYDKALAIDPNDADALKK